MAIGKGGRYIGRQEQIEVAVATLRETVEAEVAYLDEFCAANPESKKAAAKHEMYIDLEVYLREFVRRL